MARKESVVIKALVDSAVEIGIVHGVQAFAGRMAPRILRLEREGKLNEFQIALALGWDAPFVFGNRIGRKRFAANICDRLEKALIANAYPGSPLARIEREKQMELF